MRTVVAMFFSKMRDMIWLKKWPILVWILLFALCCYGVTQLYNPMFFQVTHVVVQGDMQEVNQEEIKQLISPWLNRNFFGINLAQIQQSVQGLSWVEYAEIKRIWPNQIKIILYLQKPAAYWKNRSFLNIYGEKFEKWAASGDNALLPRFEGPSDFAVLMLSQYQKMNRVLTSVELKVVSVVVNSNESWSIILNNNIELQLGRDQVLYRLRRFAKAYKKLLTSHHSLPKSVDLRYEQGMAVKW